MRRLFKLLFNGNKPVNVADAVGAVRVEPQRRIVAAHLREVNRGLRNINKEAKLMKRTIDTALALAISTGGLK